MFEQAQVWQADVAPIRLEPAQGDAAAGLDAFTSGLGLGSFDPSELTSLMGRNDNWAGRTSTGAKLFVKRLSGAPADTLRRLTRMQVAADLIAAADRRELRTPACLGTDRELLLIGFEYLDGARSGLELAAAGQFDARLCRRSGHAVALLHSQPIDRRTRDALDETPHPMPPLRQLTALPVQFLAEASGAQLDVWRLLQGDQALPALFTRLHDEEAGSSKCLTHGDLRLDHFLLVGDELHLTDFEELRAADPARDVGSFAGEWLYRAVSAIPAAVGANDEHALERGVSHDEILAQGVAELERVRPLVREFWAAYQEVRGADDPALGVRATAFAGWHLIERMIAGAAQRARLSAVDRAAAGIGRTAMLAPHEFADALGLASVTPADAP